VNAPRPPAESAIPPGLCESCRHARIIRSARDSLFLRCGLADTDPRFAKYPRLPVLRCDGYAERGAP